LSMAECIEIVKRALQEAIKDEGESLLNKKLHEIRVLLVSKYKVSSPCDNKSFIEQVVRKMKLESGSSSSDDYIEVTVAIPRKEGFVTPGGGMYPDYSVAEAIFVGLYQENPVEAHERMYEILEPVLLGEGRESLKKALFLPVNEASKYDTLNGLVEFLLLLNENDKKDVCRALSHTFLFLLSGLNFKTEKKMNVWRLKIKQNISALCPELTPLFSGR